MALRWTTDVADVWRAHSGERDIGFVLRRSTDGMWAWQIEAVRWSKYRSTTLGACSSERQAKASFRRAWKIWLSEHRLTEISQ